MSKRKIISNEEAAALVLSGKKSDMKKFIKAFVREIREKIVAESNDLYESVQDLIDEGYEDSTLYGCLDNSDGEEFFGLKVECVDHSGKHDGEEVKDTYAVVNASGECLAYFRIGGYYSSHDGVQWDEDELDLVKPYTIRQTVFLTATERNHSDYDFV